MNTTKIFSSFSVNDVASAKKFYEETLGLQVKDKSREGCGPMLTIALPEGGEVLVYEKKDHVPATFTVLNLSVSDIDKEVTDLSSKGIKFEKYDGVDEKGIMHDEGPLIAWFKDPAGNFFSVMKEENLEDIDDVKISRILPIKSAELFKFFVEAELLEKWAYPDGFKLKVPQLEARPHGAYLWEHSNEKEHFTCYGHFKEFSPGQRLVMLDETIKDQNGNVLFENQECSFDFRDHHEGTELSWNQCLGRLEGLLSRSNATGRSKEKGGFEGISSTY
jgi:uncharacterized protein YndB with AHSA1/START domain/predicted enzyme related to lactoylglutathione lyase